MRALAVTLASLACAVAAAQGPASDSISTRFEPGAGIASLGAADAPIVVVEFVDYRCSFCARQARAAFDQIRERYIEPGRVRYLAIELPLLGADAERDAVVARCAGMQGGYWRVHRALLIDTEFPREGPLELSPLAEATGLDLTSLAACVEAGHLLEAVRDGAARAMAHRVDATPSFFFGYPVPGEEAISIERHLVGAIGAGPVLEAIEALEHSLRGRQQRARIDR